MLVIKYRYSKGSPAGNVKATQWSPQRKPRSAELKDQATCLSTTFQTYAGIASWLKIYHFERFHWTCWI